LAPERDWSARALAEAGLPTFDEITEQPVEDRNDTAAPSTRSSRQTSRSSEGIPRDHARDFAGESRSSCGGFAGAETSESPQTRAKQHTLIPSVSRGFRLRSRDFASFCRQLAISGRTVRVGFPMRVFARLRGDLRVAIRSHCQAQGQARRGVCHPLLAYAVPCQGTRATTPWRSPRVAPEPLRGLRSRKAERRVRNCSRYVDVPAVQAAAY
jgi:hypothetical protein